MSANSENFNPRWRLMINHFLKSEPKPYTHKTIKTLREWVKDPRLSQNIKNRLQNFINEFNSRPDPYRNFVTELKRLVNADPRFRYYNTKNGNHTTVYYQTNYNMNRPRSSVNFSRAWNNKSGYVAYGHTHPNHRQGGIGTKLRNFGVRAARAVGLPLYQYSINLNRLGLLPSKFGGKTPISGHIMEKLGAVKVKGIPLKKRPGIKKRIEKKKHAYMIRAHRYGTRFRPK